MQFYILSRDDVESNDFQDRRLDILKKGSHAKLTDFSILLGSESLDSLKDKTHGKYWLTKTGYDDSISCDVYGNDIPGGYAQYNKFIGTRPVTKASSILPKSPKITTNDQGVKEAIYGEYPQTVVDEEYSKKLEAAYNKGIIDTTGKNYTVQKTQYLNASDTYVEPKIYTEYEYEGRKYIRFVSEDMNIGATLSDGREIKKGKAYWLSVDPITWLIDDRENVNIAIAKKILFSGVCYDNEHVIPASNFDETNIKKFMDNYFSKEIETSNYKDLKTSPNFKIQRLLDEINKCIAYHPDKDRISSYVKKLIDDYNKSLEKVKLDVQNGNRMTLENEETLYMKLQLNLNELLYKMQSNSPLYNVIDYIMECLDIFNSDKVEDFKDDELKKDLYTIKKRILPCLSRDNQDKIMHDIINIFEVEKDKISVKLKWIDTDSNTSEKLDYKDNTEFIKYVREKLHPILIGLSDTLQKGELISEIKQNITTDMNNNYKTNKIFNIDGLLNNINQSIINIKTMINKNFKNYPEIMQEYNKRLEEINFKEIDESLSVDEILKLVANKYSKLYRLELDIQEFINGMQTIDKYRI